jgi:hypothetical protein
MKRGRDPTVSYPAALSSQLLQATHTSAEMEADVGGGIIRQQGILQYLKENNNHLFKLPG